jgi:hypothetical protein
VRVRFDKNGKLVVKTAIPGFQEGRDVTTIQIQRFDLADVKVEDAKGKKIDESELAKLLKKETVAMASLHGEPVDPLHLRVLKEGTLVFTLPGSRAADGAGNGGPGPNHSMPRFGPANQMRPGQGNVPMGGQRGN